VTPRRGTNEDQEGLGICGGRHGSRRPVRPVGHDHGCLLQDHGIECVGHEEAGLRHLEGDGPGTGHPLTPFPPTSRHRRRRTLLAAAAAAAAAAAVLLSASSCATSEPVVTADFCHPFEAAWKTYAERRAAPEANPTASSSDAADPSGAQLPDAGHRADSLGAREDLRQTWNELLVGESAPSAAVVESVRNLDRNLLTAWSGGGDGVPGQVAARRSFENGLAALSSACARGGADVQLDTAGVPLGAPSEPTAPPSGTKR
jgi:hypothetical protein